MIKILPERIVPVQNLAQAIRMEAVKMVHHANSSHIGSCFSMADLLAALYGDFLTIDPKNPTDAERDRFVLSKGHGAAGLYATLALRGFFPMQWLGTYCNDESPLTGHVSHYVPGVEVSTGSLGHGLPIACGLAIAARQRAKATGGRLSRVVALLSDGELDEGTNWEAALFAPQQALDNLIAIVDYNKIQSFGTTQEILDLEPLVDKWQAFRWTVREIDGHDIAQILSVLDASPEEKGRPTVVIAHTTKGKGVSYMEDKLLWHYRSPNTEQLRIALDELNGGACA